jgi:hypothetical protein
MKDPTKVLLLFVPICISVVCIGLIAFQGTRIQNPRAIEFQNPNRSAIAFLRFSIENRSAEGLFDFKVDLDYDVQANSSHPTTLDMLVSGDRAVFGVPSSNMADAGENFITWANGTVCTYRSSTFELATHNFPITESSSEWAYPWDTYSSPIVYFWASPAVYSQVRVVSEPPVGFVWNLEPMRGVSREKLWEAMSLPDRLFLGLPPEGTPIFAFRISLVRDTLPFLASAIYAIAGIMIVWLAGGLARTSIPDRERRIPALITLAIAALAFSWSFHQVAPPSPTVVEALVVVLAMSWLVLEALDVLRKRPKFVRRLDDYVEHQG